MTVAGLERVNVSRSLYEDTFSSSRPWTSIRVRRLGLWNNTPMPQSFLAHTVFELPAALQFLFLARDASVERIVALLP